MKDATACALNALNGVFYASQAESFSSTRWRPWAGFSRVLRHVHESAPRVLDVGCGNGRLVTALRERFSDLEYVGLDASDALLARARERFADSNTLFAQGDFVQEEPERVLPRGSYDLVTLFAVLHHVPQHERRRALLQAAAKRLAPGGVLCFTLWRYDADPRFAARCVAVAEAQLPDGQQLAAEELDHGDYLLRWGTHENALRYCHFVDEAELQRLLEGLDTTPVDRFRADGAGDALNDYLVLRG